MTRNNHNGLSGDAIGSMTSAGFTLIEIMVVVTIVGLLAAMAIPTYAKWTTRAKQTEVKANLTGIYTAEVTYFAENNFFSQYFFDPANPALQVIDVEIIGPESNLYTYDLFGGLPGGVIPAAPKYGVVLPDPCYPTWAGGLQSFTAIAYANPDRDPAIDTWFINLDKTPTACKDDFASVN